MLITSGWKVLQRSDALCISLDFSLLKFSIHISSPDSKPDKYAGDDDHLHQCDGETSAYLLSKDDWLLAYLLPIDPLYRGSLNIKSIPAINLYWQGCPPHCHGVPEGWRSWKSSNGEFQFWRSQCVKPSRGLAWPPGRKQEKAKWQITQLVQSHWWAYFE